MYPNYDIFAPVVYLEFAVFALLLGLCAACVAALIFKRPIRPGNVAIGAFSGCICSVVVMYVLGHADYKYSLLAAAIVAVGLPALYAVYRKA